jgi:hypothetical protein
MRPTLGWMMKRRWRTTAVHLLNVETDDDADTMTLAFGANPGAETLSGSSGRSREESD